MAFVERASRLSEQELEALTRAGTWYANYFAREIAAEASETAAYAVEERRAHLGCAMPCPTNWPSTRPKPREVHSLEARTLTGRSLNGGTDGALTS
jgi:hypothetical protein